jgi:hypothetical protein
MFTPTLRVVVHNASNRDVDAVIVSFAGCDVPMGLIPPTAHKSYGPITVDVPERASVAWVSADGHGHTREVNVRSRASRNTSGDLVFTIVDSGDVEVAFNGDSR